MVKEDFPVSEIRRFLEPGPVVLVSSRLNGRNNIMTMGWHTVMEFTPSLIGCIIAGTNYSHQMIKESRECVINIPSADLIDKIISIGTTSGSVTDKFTEFRLTPVQGEKVQAPLIDECYANFECRLADDQLIEKYNFFIFEVLKAHKASQPRFPVTVHYRGDGIFMISGKHIEFRERLKGM